MAKKGKKIQNIGLSLFTPDNEVETGGKIILPGDDNKSSIKKIELTTNGKLPPDIIAQRLKDRTIPHVDDGFKKNDLSPEALQRFYERCRVGEYIKSVNGGKYVKFNFGDMLNGYRLYTDDNGENAIIRKLSYAEISKKSFINNMNLTIRYINYFIEYFDDDDELMQAYFKFMVQMHLMSVELPVKDFIETVYSTLASKSMVNKVIAMVEYNTDETLIKKTDRQYDESIQLTVEHLKAIMGTSIFTRFVIPIASHYYAIRRAEVEAAGMCDKDLYFQVFQTFTDLFDKHYDINLYEKLYHTATTRISKTENREILMWKRRERFGKGTTNFTYTLMRDYMNDIVQKVVFNQSAIIFIHVCFDKSIRNELIQPDKYEMSDMKMEPSDSVNESISRFDRWQMDRTQHSERDRLRAYASIKHMVWMLGEDVGLRFYKIPDQNNPNKVSPDKETQAEFEFYQKNIKKPLFDTQLYLISLYCSNSLGTAEDVKMMEFEDIIKVIMIMKRDLRRRNYNYLPYFISGTVKATSIHKKNPKNVAKTFENNPLYKDWVDQYKDTINQINMTKFYGELNNALSCPITVVEYESELNGVTIRPTDLSLIDEWCRFMCEL